MDTSHPDFISHDLDTLFMHLAISQDTAILAQFVEDYLCLSKISLLFAFKRLFSTIPYLSDLA